MASSPAAPPSDSFSQKTEAELRYLIQHPDFYHQDVVAAARRELHQRGLDTRLNPDAQAATPLPDFAEIPTERRWLAPTIGLGLLLLTLLGWRYSDTSRPVIPKATRQPPATLRAVELRPLRTFDSLITTQVQRQKGLLPAAERADTTAMRKYLLLARRYWTAENQSEYLYTQANQDQTDDRFPGLIKLNAEQWHSLTSVLVYDHKLQPVMQKRLALMKQAADFRMEMLNQIAYRSMQGLPMLVAGAHASRDSAFYLRQTLLGIPVDQRITPGALRADVQENKAGNDVRLSTTLPAARAGQNPVYILNGQLLHSDPHTGEAPAPIQALPPDSIGRILVYKQAAAVKLFGPQAHDGAVVIYTKGALRFLEDEPAD